MTTSYGILVITLLIAQIFHATMNRITKVEDDFQKMRELKNMLRQTMQASKEMKHSLESFLAVYFSSCYVFNLNMFCLVG